MEPHDVKYLNLCEDLRHSMYLSRFTKLPESQKHVLMKAFMKVLCRHSEYLPLMKHSIEPSTIEHTPIYTAKTFYKSLRELQKNKVKTRAPIKIELGCFPTADFVFSQDQATVPEFYKNKIQVPMDNQITQQFPVNILLANVNIFKYFNASRFLNQPQIIPALPQVPMQSYITYLWSSAVDQYYQVALQNNLPNQ